MQYVFWTSPLCKSLAQVLLQYLQLQIVLYKCNDPLRGRKAADFEIDVVVSEFTQI